MADQTRQPASGADLASEAREQTIESLLVTGLDRYFAGEYDQAIHAWTRVLFLDRNHARARAYIDRARAVQAEGHRETDELLHRGLAALDAGETERARTLLASAVERGGAVEAAQVALDRLQHLAVGHKPFRALPAPAAPATREEAAARPRRRLAPWLLGVAAAALLVVAGSFALRWQGFDTWGRSSRRAAATAPAPRTGTSFPQPSLGDLAMRRAQSLFARGHLHEALAELDTIPVGDARRHEADRVRAEIQRGLLTAASAPVPSAEGAAILRGPK